MSKIISKHISFGLLSTLDSPTLPYYIEALLENGVVNFHVIFDSKKDSEINKRLWVERTGGYLEWGFEEGGNVSNLQKKAIPYCIVENHNDEGVLQYIKENGISCLFNAGTPRKLSSNLIQTPSFGVINIHPGILPKFRGCSAVEWAILQDERIGNTAHFMGVEYDTGPIIEIESYIFPKHMNYQSIRVHVFLRGFLMAGRLLLSIQKKYPKILSGIFQDEQSSKYWNPIPDSDLSFAIDKVSSGNYKYQTDSLDHALNHREFSLI